MFKIVIGVTTYECPTCYKMGKKNVQISANYEKIIFKSFILSTVLARPGTILNVIG